MFLPASVLSLKLNSTASPFSLSQRLVLFFLSLTFEKEKEKKRGGTGKCYVLKMANHDVGFPRAIRRIKENRKESSPCPVYLLHR